VSSGASGDLLRSRPAPLAPLLTEEESAAHERFVAGLGKEPIWLRYLAREEEEAGVARRA
jgi:DNA polymerase-3 subunit epsilon